jgi:hypothetical protein
MVTGIDIDIFCNIVLIVYMFILIAISYDTKIDLSKASHKIESLYM